MEFPAEFDAENRTTSIFLFVNFNKKYNIMHDWKLLTAFDSSWQLLMAFDSVLVFLWQVIDRAFMYLYGVLWAFLTAILSFDNILNAF